MRVISFEGADGRPSIGVMVDDDAFVDVCQVDPKIARSLRTVLEDPDGLAHMRPGDTVEVEISGLGVLRNHVIADMPVQYRPSLQSAPLP